MLLGRPIAACCSKQSAGGKGQGIKLLELRPTLTSAREACALPWDGRVLLPLYQTSKAGSIGSHPHTLLTKKKGKNRQLWNRLPHRFPPAHAAGQLVLLQLQAVQQLKCLLVQQPHAVAALCTRDVQSRAVNAGRKSKAASWLPAHELR